MRRLQQLKDKRTRRLWAVLLGGKMLGLVAVMAIIQGVNWYIQSKAGAQTDTVVVHRPDIINPVNTMWVLVTAFLVFFMQAGFMALEAGFARSRETVNVLLECVVDTCLAGLLYYAFGFAFQFGEGNGLIGHQFFMLHGAPATYGSTGVAFMAFW
ncbi:MAG: ammonium transporter, partial [Actinobacteria bacterium]|nr:ammonium transporter [Actinomycetota bacterium]